MSSLPAAPDARPDTSGLTPDYETTLRFLDLLFEGVAPGFVEFQYSLPSKKPRHRDLPTFLSLPLDRDRLRSEVLSRGGRQVITFGTAPRCRIPSRGSAGKEHDVLQARCAWTSIEHARTKGGAIEALRRIRDFPLRPSVVVNAGSAHQVYFVFHEPLRDHALLGWNEITHGLGVILSAGAAPAVNGIAYLPGTVLPLEAYPIPCSVTEENSSWTRYSVAEVEGALRSSLAAGAGKATGLVMTVEQLRGRGLDADVVEAIITGQALPRHVYTSPAAESDSGADFRLAFFLFERGFGEGEIKAVFRAHPHGCGRRWARKRDGEGYLTSLIRKVTVKSGEADRAVIPGTDWRDDDDSLAARLPAGYTEGEDGSMWFHPPVPDDNRKPPRPVKVCNSPLRITEIQENIDTGQISVAISFQYLGRTVSVPVTRSQMADARQLVATLSGVGAPINSLNARLITAYLAAYEHSFAAHLPRKKVTSRFGRGRADGPFFFPGVSSDVEFTPLGAGDASLYRAYASRRGSLRGWLDALRAVEREALMIPQVAVLAALVPPLQRRLQIPNFILDLHGNTSTGKSTSLKLAASVYGSPNDPDSLILQWMNTSVAIEQLVATCSELPVFLDDAQHCPPELKRLVVYMIANGRGKGRGARSGRGGLGETPSWNTVALSTSEEPLHESSPHEGARGRILPVGGLTPAFRPGTASLVKGIERVVGENHGHAGEAYIRHLNGWTAADVSRWHRRYTEITGELLRSSSSDLMGRVGGYVAAVQVAAELACPLLGLPFKPDVVGSWLALHVDERQKNQNLILLALRALADHYVSNLNRFAGDGRHDLAGRVSLQGVSKRHRYVGFLRSTVDAIFKVRRWNTTAVLNKIAQAEALYATEHGRHTKKVSVEGVKHRMVCVKWSAILPEDRDLTP
jgi:hypothetical protein